MKKELFVYVGTYTEPIRFGTGKILVGKGEGIYLYKMDMESGKLTISDKTVGVVNPSYLTLDPTKKFLYSVNELKEFEGLASGAVSSFEVEPGTGKLSFLNKRATRGTDPCHVCTNDLGTHVYVSNFMSGSVCVFPILKDGSLDKDSQFIQHEGSSVNPTRQVGPHAHSLIFSPSNNYAFVPDLGIDKLMSYKTDFEKGCLETGVFPKLSLTPGSGPRHCVFHQNGKFLYLICELDSTMIAYIYDEEKCTFEYLQTVPTLPADFSGESTCADVQILPNGEYIYGSNRGHDSVVIYRIDQKSGKLSYVDHVSTHGKTPRNFAIDPTGTFLLVGNQDSDNIVVFRINPLTGMLDKVFETEVPTPVCIKPYFMD